MAQQQRIYWCAKCERHYWTGDRHMELRHGGRPRTGEHLRKRVPRT